MTKIKRNPIHKMLKRQAQKPVIKARELLVDFKKTPAFTLSQLKKHDSRALLLVAKALSKRHQATPDAEEKEAIGKLILFIRDTVAERKIEWQQNH